MRKQFTFRIAGSYSPDNIPLERLGEYLEALGELFGEKANVHFGGLESGSTLVNVLVDHTAVPKVEKRVRSVASGDAPAAAAKAYARIDNLLREDNASGTIVGGPNNVIHVDFPGAKRPEPVSYGPIKQLGAIDGEIFRVEGRDSTVHVGVMDGPRTYSLEAAAELGPQLASLFRAGTVRFAGEGTWLRAGTGEWELRKFKIDRFEVLDSSPLSDAIARLREIGSGDWSTMPDALSKLASERGDEESKH